MSLEQTTGRGAADRSTAEGDIWLPWRPRPVRPGAPGAAEPRPMGGLMDPKTNVMPAPDAWCLEGFSADGRQTWRTVVGRGPFHVGRGINSDLVLSALGVSWRHASLSVRQGTVWLRDLGSTNGTFLNGERITSERPLSAGDVIHFADQECRLVGRDLLHRPRATQNMSLAGVDLQPQLFERQRMLRQMLRDAGLMAAFQPVMRLADRTIVGYELLGRGEFESREILPLELFDVAGTLGLELELSAALRARGLEDSKALPGDPVVFVNTHPAELKAGGGGLLASLERMRTLHPSARLVLEIHEAAVANPSALQALRSQLTSLDIGLAFDDFGIGQTRLLELIEACPHYVKFDRIWIKDLHRAARQRREMVETLVGLVRELDIATVAVGVETAEEAKACTDLGFELAQGYYFGRPAPATSLAASS